MPNKRVEENKIDSSVAPGTGWKVILARAVVKVPATFSELIWKGSLIGFGVIAFLSGMLVYRNPGIFFGKPIAEKSITERLASDEGVKNSVFGLMQNYYYTNEARGLMLVSWEELDSLSGIWVRPADKFPGKSGEHDLTPDMRHLVGPFIFRECSSTPSLAMRDHIMVACPIASSYDVWGYVAVVVENDEKTISKALNSLNFLAHRITRIIY